MDFGWSSSDGKWDIKLAHGSHYIVENHVVIDNRIGDSYIAVRSASYAKKCAAQKHRSELLSENNYMLSMYIVICSIILSIAIV